MTSSHLRFGLLAVLLVALAGGGIAYMLRSDATEILSLAELPEVTHIHGIAVDAADSSQLLLATHHGLFRVAPDATATRISATRDDFMGFTPHPTDAAVLYASGHPEGGGNLGFIVSRDRGKSWQQLSPGVGGPVDFHQMDVSKADPEIIYGAYQGLQTSRDGGRSWSLVGPQPEGLIDLAVSAGDPETLYAATETGLLISDDGGRSWRTLYAENRPASLVETARDGTIHAYVVGTGLVKAEEPALDWQTVSGDFGDHIPLHLAVDPTDPDRLYVATRHSAVLASADGGRSWAPFGAANVD